MGAAIRATPTNLASKETRWHTRHTQDPNRHPIHQDALLWPKSGRPSGHRHPQRESSERDYRKHRADYLRHEVVLQPRTLLPRVHLRDKIHRPMRRACIATLRLPRDHRKSEETASDYERDEGRDGRHSDSLSDGQVLCGKAVEECSAKACQERGEAQRYSCRAYHPNPAWGAPTRTCRLTLRLYSDGQHSGEVNALKYVPSVRFTNLDSYGCLGKSGETWDGGGGESAFHGDEPRVSSV
ncbi:hypothetical protein L226DRAFT_152392 [Lentinus tigrinus ALCF2SS1-7]|uniref:uncharacterized protein n=1 Tax=Lentinus tigrinus ALCF2SS1-7 TaxID=1328758 RepID=UPI001165EAB6|nr:hypothetical protein L226DRAFT_152392 [Lentinus tigrinus ALCF2SS1-7]